MAKTLKQYPKAHNFFQPHIMRRALIAITGLTIGYLPTVSVAQQNSQPIQQEATKTYAIQSGELTQALNRFGRDANILLSFSTDMTNGLQSNGLNGTFTVVEGLRHLLDGTGLAADQLANGSYSLHRQLAAKDVGKMTTVHVTAAADLPSDLPPVYAGGQVARGARVGMLGNQDVLDTPFNITSYTSENIANQQAQTMGEAMATDPSVRNFIPHSFMEQYTFRGLMLYNDDVSFNGLAGLMPLSLIDTSAIERLEVFKGPSSMLNGVGFAQSLGGAINIIPKRADDIALARITGTYTSQSQFGGQADLGRRWGDDNEFGVRVNAAYRDGDLARDNTSQEFGHGVIALDYRGENTRVSLDAGAQETTTSGSGSYILMGGLFKMPEAPDASSNFSQPWITYINRDRFFAFKAEHDFSDQVSAHVNIGKSYYMEKYWSDFVRITNAEGDANVDSWWRYDYRYLDAAEAGSNVHFDTASIKHDVSLSVSFLYNNGADHWEFLPDSTSSNIYQPVFIPKPDLTGTLYKTPLDNYAYSKGIAIADNLSMLDDRLLISIGARHQNLVSGGYDNKQHDEVYGESRVTPMLGVVIKPSKELSLYANYIEGLQQGEQVGAGYQNTGEIFKPFKTTQYEFGAKYDFGKFAATIDTFQMEIPNEIDVPAPPGLPYLKLDGEQRNRGIELNIFGEIVPSVRLLGGVMLLDARMTKTQDGTNDGRTANGSPKTNINMSVEWDTPFIPGLTLTGGEIYTSSQVRDPGNIQSIPSWIVFNAGARYKISIADKPVTIRAKVDNVFDKDYWSSTARGFGVVRGEARIFQLSISTDI